MENKNYEMDKSASRGWNDPPPIQFSNTTTHPKRLLTKRIGFQITNTPSTTPLDIGTQYVPNDYRFQQFTENINIALSNRNATSILINNKGKIMEYWQSDQCNEHMKNIFMNISMYLREYKINEAEHLMQQIPEVGWFKLFLSNVIGNLKT